MGRATGERPILDPCCSPSARQKEPLSHHPLPSATSFRVSRPPKSVPIYSLSVRMLPLVHRRSPERLPSPTPPPLWCFRDCRSHPTTTGAPTAGEERHHIAVLATFVLPRRPDEVPLLLLCLARSSKSTDSIVVAAAPPRRPGDRRWPRHYSRLRHGDCPEDARVPHHRLGPSRPFVPLGQDEPARPRAKKSVHYCSTDYSFQNFFSNLYSRNSYKFHKFKINCTKHRKYKLNLFGIHKSRSTQIA
jgi:hypothetical protein